MDGKGCWRDNVFVERFWKTLEYEEVYLHAYDGVSEAKAYVERYLTFYNGQRTHSSLGRHTRGIVYFSPAAVEAACLAGSSLKRGRLAVQKASYFPGKGDLWLLLESMDRAMSGPWRRLEAFQRQELRAPK